MFSLGKHIQHDKLRIGMPVGNHDNLGRTGDTVDGNMSEHLFLCQSDILVAWPGNLVDFRYAFCPISKCRHRLGTAKFVNGIDPRYLCSHKNMLADIAFVIAGRRNKNLFHTCNLCRSDIHQK